MIPLFQRLGLTADAVSLYLEVRSSYNTSHQTIPATKPYHSPNYTTTLRFTTRTMTMRWILRRHVQLFDSVTTTSAHPQTHVHTHQFIQFHGELKHPTRIAKKKMKLLLRSKAAKTSGLSPPKLKAPAHRPHKHKHHTKPNKPEA